MIKVAVIPCFKTKEKAADVALKSLNYVDKVICVDDNCPYKTYEFSSCFKIEEQSILSYFLKFSSKFFLNRISNKELVMSLNDK